jgi:hypothetical protein
VGAIGGIKYDNLREKAMHIGAFKKYEQINKPLRT